MALPLGGQDEFGDLAPPLGPLALGSLGCLEGVATQPLGAASFEFLPLGLGRRAHPLRLDAGPFLRLPLRRGLGRCGSALGLRLIAFSPFHLTLGLLAVLGLHLAGLLPFRCQLLAFAGDRFGVLLLSERAEV